MSTYAAAQFAGPDIEFLSETLDSSLLDQDPNALDSFFTCCHLSRFFKQTPLQLGRFDKVSWNLMLYAQDFVGITRQDPFVGYAFPLFQTVIKQPSVRRLDGPVAVILCSRPEVAHERRERLQALAISIYPSGQRPVFGGFVQGVEHDGMMDQDRPPQILVLTVGQWEALLENKESSFSRLSILVVDGLADILKDGLPEVLVCLLNCRPKNCQTIIYTSDPPERAVISILDFFLPAAPKFRQTIMPRADSPKYVVNLTSDQHHEVNAAKYKVLSDMVDSMNESTPIVVLGADGESCDEYEDQILHFMETHLLSRMPISLLHRSTKRLDVVRVHNQVSANQVGILIVDPYRFEEVASLFRTAVIILHFDSADFQVYEERLSKLRQPPKKCVCFVPKIMDSWLSEVENHPQSPVQESSPRTVWRDKVDGARRLWEPNSD